MYQGQQLVIHGQARSRIVEEGMLASWTVGMWLDGWLGGLCVYDIANGYRTCRKEYLGR